MNSRQRIHAAINHMEPDRVPLDIGGTHNTSIHVFAQQRLLEALHMNKKPVKIFDPMLMIGVIEEDLAKAIGSDCIALNNPFTLLNYRNENWKPWTAPNGMTFLVGEKFEYKLENDTVYLYPRGNKDAAPSARMILGQAFFDAIVRQSDIDEDSLDAREDYKEDNYIFTDKDLRFYEKESKHLYNNTEMSVIGSFYGGGLGDLMHIQAPGILEPKGIRDMSEWMMATYLYPNYIKEVHEIQTETIIENLKLYHQAVGERISCIAIAGTDFGSQKGLLYAKDVYKEFYKPYFKRINQWVHENTTWKTWYHSCGSVHELFEDFIDAEYDIINPIQITAEGMEPAAIKKKYGDRLVFWGGGIDTQKTLPFGTPEEIAAEVTHNVSILKQGGGYVCGTIHNITDEVPAENIIAFYTAAIKA